MPKAAEILEGARGPRQAREQYIKSLPPREEEAPPGEGTCYYSKYEKYRHQITSPHSITDPYTGRTTRDTPMVAQFDAHFFRNDNPDLQKRKAIDDALQGDRKHFGLNKVFWLHDDAVKANRDKYVKGALEQIKTDPLILEEIEKQVQARLKMGTRDDLPTPEARA